MSQENSAAPLSVFVQRLFQFNRVKQASEKVAEVYEKVKNNSQLANRSLTFAETSVSTVATKLAPLQKYVEKPLKYLDSVLCSALDEVETMPVKLEKRIQMASEVVDAAKKRVQENSKLWPLYQYTTSKIGSAVESAQNTQQKILALPIVHPFVQYGLALYSKLSWSREIASKQQSSEGHCS